MSQYSIKEIEQLSGIKAHTLRVWEQRYNFIKPKRTHSNIRYYDGEDLKLVLNISFLKDSGYKLSKICNMSSDDLKMEVKGLMGKKIGYSDKMQGLTIALLELDEDRFEKIISTNILHVGFESTMINLILPFFNKVGILWQTGTISPAQEHFFSNLVRQKLIVAIDGLMSNADNFKNKYLLFLPENECHELGLLLASYIIKSRNNKVIYIGQNAPIKDLVKINENHSPDFILTILTTSPSNSDVQKYSELLSASFASATILLSGNQISNLKMDLPNNVILISKFQDLIDHIEKNTNNIFK